MTAQPTVAALVLAVLLALASCAGSDPDARSDANLDRSPSSSAVPTSEATGPAAGPLVGTFRSPTIPIASMGEVARAAGFNKRDIEEYLAGNFGDARDIRYTLKLTDDEWVVFGEIDGGAPEEMWYGPYEVVDESTVLAGAPPCGPITYGYKLEDDVLSLDVTDEECPGPDDKIPAGEQIAQATIYETAPFTRVG